MVQDVVEALIRAAAREFVQEHAVILYWGLGVYRAAAAVAYGGS